ncbi:GNAT family N-acetyltransferase [Methanimicrococcus blatticola]|nr:GNAT family N-acetyltransferase [Methanimicrococcus blatticola]MBZ3935836.1 GNAT family N-acetyltransferase [Methanimicrococcus blatticola]MCC2508044.1 GNAT family N-acetyltransferase [Methanimicrococcus blatticola]
MTFKIKKLETDKELDNVAALAKEIWTEHYTPLIGPAQTEYMLRVFQSPERIKTDIRERNFSYFAVVSEDSEEQIAYLALQPDERGVFISKIYVKKEFRRLGIAKMLIRFSLDFAKEEIKSPNSVFDASKNTRPCLWLTVNKGNSGPIEFYKKEGFVIDNEAVTDIGHDFYMNDYIMTLYFDDEKEC